MKVRNQGNADNSHIGHCILTAESANVEAQDMFNVRNNITCSTDCKYRTAAKLYTLETWYIIVYTLHKSDNQDDDDDDNKKNNKPQVIPIVISSTGVIPKSISQSLTKLNLHPNTYIQLQKSVILGTCSVVRNFLKYK